MTVIRVFCPAVKGFVLYRAVITAGSDFGFESTNTEMLTLTPTAATEASSLHHATPDALYGVAAADAASRRARQCRLQPLRTLSVH